MTKVRIPQALILSMFVAAVSLGLIVICWNQHWPVAPGLELVVHMTALLSFVWASTNLLVSRFRPASTPKRMASDIQAVLQVASITMVLTVVVIMVYVATSEALTRSPYLINYQATWRIHIWRTGLLDLGLVMATAIIGWARTRDRQLTTICLWLLAMAGFWLSLQSPAFMRVTTLHGSSYQTPARWAVILMVWVSLAIVCFIVSEGAICVSRRVRAWPDALDNLTRQRLAWPGFDYSVALLGLVVLLLACIYIVSPWSTLSAFITGAAVLALAGRRWNTNLGDLGLGLFSIGIVSLPLLASVGFPRAPEAYFAEIFNRIVIGLAIATAFWHWLGSVWQQQLDEGKAWTTAGRLIRNTRRVGFLCGATGVLAGFQLAMWPKFPGVVSLDASAWRWTWGLAGYFLLILSLLYAGRVTRKTTLGWLTVFAFAPVAAFIATRLSHTAPVAWSLRSWPLLIAGLSLITLGLAHATRRSTRWSFLTESLILISVLLGPLAAMLGISACDPFTLPHWLPSAVFGTLTAVYTLACFVLDSRRYFIAAGATLMALIYGLLLL